MSNRFCFAMSVALAAPWVGCRLAIGYASKRCEKSSNPEPFPRRCLLLRRKPAMRDLSLGGGWDIQIWKQDGAGMTQQSDGNSRETTPLSALIERHTPIEGANMTGLERLTLYRKNSKTDPVPAVYEPVLCICVQGEKRLLAGEGVYPYSPEDFALVTTSLPLSGQIMKASRQSPYLGLRLKLDLASLRPLIAEVRTQWDAVTDSAVMVGHLDSMLRDAVRRLILLLDTPQHVSVLYPLIEREIAYLLLQSELGPRLRREVLRSAADKGLNNAIQQLKRNFSKSFTVDELARMSHLSRATFHRHFVQKTGISPMQYQKLLRLHEARRLLLASLQDVSTVAYLVGYESVSHFTREYRRLFGAPPFQDSRKFRADAAAPHRI
jgi:AraC-like DNA-binding protein